MSATVTIKTPHGRRIVTDLSAALPLVAREQARVDANQWIKNLRLAPYDGAPMRQRFTFRGDSLWWFTELYLHKMRRIDVAISTILALEAIVAEHAPAKVTVETADPTVGAAARAFSRVPTTSIEVLGGEGPGRKIGWPSFAIGFNARLSRLRASRSIDRHPNVAAFVHTAFWRHSGAKDGPAQESYVGAVLNAVAAQGRESDLFCVGVGPRRNFRARRWWDPVAAGGDHSRMITPIERIAPNRALQDSFRLWRDRRRLAHLVTSGQGIRDAARYHDCDLWPILERELTAVAMLQWPWSARAMDEAGAALDALQPGAAVTYAEAGGWGRALVLEARRRQIPSIGLQHGFIYRHWLNYRHELDEFKPIGRDIGCPIPDRTLVFDRYAEATLREGGHFTADRVKVTGNARLDDLAAQIAMLRPIRSTIRQELGVADRSLAVLAAKFSEIRHVLGDLTEAVAGLPEMQLIIKPHPAETAEVYAPIAGGISNISIAPTRADLARLLVAADAIVTMNSTVAIDAIVLNVPALVIGLPNNLSPFVDGGAMVGAAGPAEIRDRLQSLLYDQDARRKVIAAGEAFARRYELRSDGQAARRAATEILAMAAHPSAQRGEQTR